MEENVYFIAITAASMLIASGLGWVLTEYKRPVFNFKPFNCRPCLTFWLCMGLSFTGNHFYLSAFDAAAVSLLPSFVLYVFISSKTQIYE